MYVCVIRSTLIIFTRKLNIIVANKKSRIYDTSEFRFAKN